MGNKNFKFKYSRNFLEKVFLKESVNKYILIYLLTDDMVYKKDSLQSDLLEFGIKGKFIKKTYLFQMFKKVHIQKDIEDLFFGEIFICNSVENNKFFTFLNKKTSQKNILVPTFIINEEGILFYSSFISRLNKLDKNILGTHLIYKLLLVFVRLKLVLSYKVEKC